MIQRPWFERTFRFELPVEASFGLIERLRGTPCRLEERVLAVDSAHRVRSPEGAWSIQEHAGHLGDLEPLWLGRMDDLDAGLARLRPADLTNRGTHEAAHNEADLQELLERFRESRRTLVERLELASDAQWVRSAKHPRLEAEMRLLDLAFFVAEHDDHHLAKIRGILASF